MAGMLLYTGHLFEEEVFGRCRAKANGYIPYRQALAEVEANQPWDPTDPGTRFANDLHAEVASALGLDDWTGLRFFTAIGSALDRYHGIDAFFRFGIAIVTLDVTLNDAKRNGYKADIIVPSAAVEEAPYRGELALAIAASLAH